MAGDICVPDEKSSGGEGGDTATDEIDSRIVVLGRSMVFHKESSQLLRPLASEEGQASITPLCSSSKTSGGYGLLCLVVVNPDRTPVRGRG